MAVSIFKFGTSSPADTTPLKELKSAGYDSEDILAVVGKTEGERYHV
jgi:cyanuric acid amidohydrolase